MESITREQIELLVEIQELGRRKDAAMVKINDAPGKLAALDGQIEASKEELEKMESRLKEIQKAYRDDEGEVQRLQGRRRDNRVKLNAVKDNKAYHALLKENEDIDKKVSSIEDRMLTVLDEQEELESAIGNKRKENDALAVRIEQEKKAVSGESELLAKNVAELEKRMEHIGESVDADLLDKYNWVRGRVGRSAIVPVEKAVCQGCHLNIPPQMYNELHRCDRLEFCPHCQRIIYCKDGS